MTQVSQDGRLAYNPVMSPNQVIEGENQVGDTFMVPNLPFSQAQRNEIFSEASSRVYRELCGPEGVVLQQNNALQQVIQEVHTHPFVKKQSQNIKTTLVEEMAKVKLTLRQSSLLTKPVPNTRLCWKVCNPLLGLKSEQTKQFRRCCIVSRVCSQLFNKGHWSSKRTRPWTGEYNT